MNKYRPAEIGMALEDVDTPALLLDLDAFEFNIQLMAGFAKNLVLIIDRMPKHINLQW